MHGRHHAEKQACRRGTHDHGGRTEAEILVRGDRRYQEVRETFTAIGAFEPVRGIKAATG
jgi:hypothetical protein